jgi:hypothetical protein
MNQTGGARRSVAGTPDRAYFIEETHPEEVIVWNPEAMTLIATIPLGVEALGALVPGALLVGQGSRCCSPFATRTVNDEAAMILRADIDGSGLGRASKASGEPAARAASSRPKRCRQKRGEAALPAPRKCRPRTLLWLPIHGARNESCWPLPRWGRIDGTDETVAPSRGEHSAGAGFASKRRVVFSSFRRRAKPSLGVVLAAWLMGCASIGSKYTASPVDAQGRVTAARSTESGLVISGEELRMYASNYFGLIEITFENPTANWVHVSRLTLDFGDAARNSAVLTPSAADLDAWYLSTVQRNDIRATNHATALGALFAVGQVVAIAGAVSGKRGVTAAGGVVALGAATAALAEGQEARVQEAESVHVLPQSHLLALPFAIPPGLFTKKWILLQTRSITAPCVSSLLMDYDVQERGRERVLVRFRHGSDHSEWQRLVCGSPS